MAMHKMFLGKRIQKVIPPKFPDGKLVLHLQSDTPGEKRILMKVTVEEYRLGLTIQFTGEKSATQNEKEDQTQEGI